MVDIFFNPDDITYFLLLLVRLSTVLFVTPLFGAGFMPGKWKIGFSVVLAVVMYIAVPRPGDYSLEPSAINLLLAGGREILVGILIGLTTGIVFSAVMLWGQIIATQMGLGLAKVIDPKQGMDVPTLSQLKYMIALSLFFAVNGHHLLIDGLRDACVFLPIGGMSIHVGGMSEFIDLSGKVFSVAVRLASPMMVLLLLVSVSLGIIARTVPQMNIFVVGLPLKLLAGIFGLCVSIPYVARALIDLINEIPGDLMRVMGAV